MLPTGKASKEFINETARLLNAWVDDSSLKYIAFKAIMVLPRLLLQKPSKKSKTDGHCAALQCRLTLWHDGNVLELLTEGAIMQGIWKSVNTGNTIGEISKRFLKKMRQDNINGAIKLLTNNMQNGVLPVNEKTLELLRQKHPKTSPAIESVLVTDAIEKVHPIKFENGRISQKSCAKDKRWFRPFSNGCRRIENNSNH